MKDVIDELIEEWQREATELDLAGMGVAGRLIALGDLLREKTARALSPFDLSYREFDVLATLRRGGPPYTRTVGELASAVILTSGAMTACLKRLEDRQLLRRVRDEHDRRTVNVTLTADGKSLALAAAKARFRDVAHLTGDCPDLTDRELENRLRRILLATK